jgi:TadE-like protein
LGTAGSGRERGSAAVELALVLPLALLAALALVQVGLVGKEALLVIQAAREGAREAAVTTEDARVRGAALRGGNLHGERTQVEVFRGGMAGDPVTVRVEYHPPLLVPFVGWLFPDQVALTASATMRQEAGGLAP